MKKRLLLTIWRLRTSPSKQGWLSLEERARATSKSFESTAAASILKDTIYRLKLQTKSTPYILTPRHGWRHGMAFPPNSKYLNSRNRMCRKISIKTQYYIEVYSVVHDDVNKSVRLNGHPRLTASKKMIEALRRIAKVVPEGWPMPYPLDNLG